MSASFRGVFLCLSLFVLLLLLSSSHAADQTFTMTTAKGIIDEGTIYSTITTSGITPTTMPGNTGGTLLVSLKLKITHTYCGDLIVKLCNPAGLCARISDRFGGSCDTLLVDRWLDDNQATALTSTSCGVQYMRPTDNFMATFGGNNPNGAWTLSVQDAANNDGGTLHYWELHFQSCNQATYPCGGNSVCVNSVVPYTCSCLAGFTGSAAPGSSCTDINECTVGTHNCHATNGFCVNTPGSFSCYCKNGYTGDGRTCTATPLGEIVFKGTGSEHIDWYLDTVTSYITTSGIPFSSIPGNTNGLLLVSLKLKITHANPRDLEIDLCDPSGSCNRLSGRQGDSCDNYFNERWIDDVQAWRIGSSYSCSSLPTNMAPQDSTGFQGRFNGHNPNGQWTLVVDDVVFFDEGDVHSWELHFQSGCFGGPCMNRGICTATGWRSNAYTCNCDGTGYTGSTCATELNECTTGTYPCGGNTDCTNTVGSFTCACKSGYTGNPASGSSCTDVNECSSNPCHALATCSNTLGSYTCTCIAGYSGNGKTTCTNVDECQSGGGNTCAAGTSICTDTTGSYTCACKPGYLGNGFTCTDADECLNQGSGNNCATTPVGSSTCTNTVGSFTCACKPGYTGSGTSCADKNECLAGGGHNCHADATCTNNVGSFTCACKPGYSGNGVSCANIDECTTGTFPCTANETCVDSPGSYSCVCKSGYSGSPCRDVNECSDEEICDESVSDCVNTPGSYYCKCKEGTDPNGCSPLDFCGDSSLNNCSDHAQCNSLHLGFNCTCLPGFTGDGVTCTNINECANPTFPCHPDATCADTEGSFTCTCKPGYYQSGSVCVDYNECLGEGGNNDCHLNAQCTNNPGSFACACNVGYLGNGTHCTDANECEDQAPGNNCADGGISTCTNTVGSYYCACNLGYSGDGVSCVDVDECGGVNNCHADADCDNSIGSFSCACKSGFAGDGIICHDLNECNGENGGDNCDVNAVCLNSPGSFECECNTEFAGDGVTCIASSVPSVSLTSSTSLEISWNLVDGASKFTLVAVDPSLNSVLNIDLSSTETEYTIDSLPSNTEFIITLTTWVLSNTRFASRNVQGVTRPAALTSTTFSVVSNQFVSFTFEKSAGALDYQYALSDGSGAMLSSGYMTTEDVDGSPTTLLGTIDHLQPNSNYSIRVFAGTETVGYSFDVTTSPAGVSGLSGRRYDDSSVIIEWTESAGTTQYNLVVGFSNGTVVRSVDFDAPASEFIVTDLVGGVMYRFTVYSGNSFGVDFLNGPFADASTLTLFCSSKAEANATWPRIVLGESTYGICDSGFGGKPLRFCLDPGAGEEEGEYGPINGTCIKIPNPLPNPPVADPYSNHAIMTWVPQADCTMFNSYVILSDGSKLPVNNGQGLRLTAPTVELQALVPLRNYTVRVYCGNMGGFETLGRDVTFQTHIPQPEPTLGEITADSVSLSWPADSYAKWYRIEYSVVDDKRRAEPTVFKAKHTGTKVKVTGLDPQTSYSIRVFAGQGQSYYEPHGTETRVKTLGDSGGNSTPDTPIGMIIGIVVGVLGLVLIAAAVLAFFVLRQNKKTKEMQKSLDRELSLREASSERTLQRKASISSRRSSVADATLLNTTMEISVPGFLLLDPSRQFRIEGTLGSGGAATVFKGVLLDHDLIAQHNTMEIAVKKIQKHPKLSDEESKERFLQEVSIMWSCAFHQNVAKLIGYTLEPTSYLLTKLYEIDLYTFVHHPDEALPPLLGLKLSGDIASAMTYMQEIGIVHRDLKSANVLLETIPLNPTQSILRAVVCDFGLARVTNSAATLENMKFREIGGFSPRYAAPEVFASALVRGTASNSDVDKKSDVYSFAIIIWELLTRQIPWDKLTRDEIEMKVRGGERPFVIADDGTDPAKSILLDLMKACWNEYPTARPEFSMIQTKIMSLL